MTSSLKGCKVGNDLHCLKRLLGWSTASSSIGRLDGVEGCMAATDEGIGSVTSQW